MNPVESIPRLSSNVGDHQFRHRYISRCRDGSVREIEHTEHQLHRIVRCLGKPAHIVAVHREHEGLRTPFNSIGVELGGIDGQGLR